MIELKESWITGHEALGLYYYIFFVQVLNLLDIVVVNILVLDGEPVQSLRCEVKTLSNSTTTVWGCLWEMSHVHLQVWMGWSLLLKEGRRKFYLIGIEEKLCLGASQSC